MQKIALIVDDSRVARMTLKKLLLAYQFDVVELASGEEALDYLHADNAKPNIIFMDVMMGGIDGLTATQEIKKNPILHNIPVVICTGNDTEEDRNKALEVGAVTALSKPPIADDLDEIIAQLDSLTPATETATAIPEVDEKMLIANVSANIEKELLPKLHQNITVTVENVSREIVAKLTEKYVAEQLNTHLQKSLEGVTEELNSKTEKIAEKVAQEASITIAQEIALDAASTAVQTVIDEADITTQVAQFLAEKGEKWLEEQEEDLGTQLSAQLEQLIPSIITEYLEANLTSIVAPLVTDGLTASSSDSLKQEDIERLINTSLHQHTNTVVEPIVSGVVSKQLEAQALFDKEDVAIHSLAKKIAMLRNITLGLALVVIGLVITVAV